MVRRLIFLYPLLFFYLFGASFVIESEANLRNLDKIIRSNIPQIVVVEDLNIDIKNEVLEFEVKNYYPEIEIEVGGEIELLYKVSNNGKRAEDYILLLQNLDILDTWDMYIDSNKNGFLDKSERIPLEKIADNIVMLPKIKAGEFENYIIKTRLKDRVDGSKIELEFQSRSDTSIKKKISNLIWLVAEEKVGVRKGIYFEKEQYYFTFKFLNETGKDLDSLILTDEISKDFDISSYLGLWQEFGSEEKKVVTFFEDGWEQNSSNLEVNLINKKLKLEIKNLPTQDKTDTGGILYIPFHLARDVEDNTRLSNEAVYYYILDGKKSKIRKTNEVLFIKGSSSQEASDYQSLLTDIKGDKEVVTRGEIFKLEIETKNGYELSQMKIELILPTGFTYLENSIKIEDNNIEKVEQDGNRVIFHLKDRVKKNSKVNLELKIRSNIGAKLGENIFKTISSGREFLNNEVFSNEDSFKIEVIKENNELKSTIFGLLFVDSNGNGIYDSGELPIPNVKILLENGHFAISDKDGRYSLIGESPRTHIAKVVDLPKGAKLKKLDNRYSKKGDFAVIDAKPSELYKLNFAVIEIDKAGLEEIEKRKEIATTLESEIEEVVSKELLFTSSNNGGVEAGGYFNSRNIELKKSQEKYEKAKALEKENIVEEKNEEEKLEDRLKRFTPKLEILNIKNGDVVPRVISVEIKDHIDNSLELYINDRLIPKSSIGIKGILRDVAYYRYDGIRVDDEENIVKVISTSKMGIRRKKEVKILYPAKIYDSELAVKNGDIELLLRGKNGVLVREPYYVNLKSSSGVWILPEDLSKDRGLQFIVEDGRQELRFLPTQEREKIDFELEIPEVNFRQNFSLQFGDSKNIFMGIAENNRIAGLATGELKGYSYEMRYENKKSDENYQNIKKDEYYLLTGDESIRGYEAQSKSKLYLNIEGENVSHLYGDYDISWKNRDIDIGNYSRSLTGYKGKYKGDKLDLEGFVSRTYNTQKFTKLEARDISGPYFVGESNIIENSEKIEIEIYNPNNLDIPLEVTKPPKYSFDHNTGIIYFDTSIPRKDKNGNLVFIKISYEVEGASRHYLYGAALSYNLSKNLKIGTSYIKDENPNSNYESKSVNLVYESEKFGKLILEKGKSDGEAKLLKYKNKKSKFTYYDSESKYDNPNSFVKKGARLFLLENSFKISQTTKLDIEGFSYEDKIADKKVEELAIDIKKNIKKNIELTLGSRHKKDQDTAGLKIDYSGIQNLETALEYEQDVDIRRNKRVALSSRYSGEKLRIYGKYDLVNRIDSTNIIGRYKGNYSKLLGMEYKNLKYFNPYIEYRELANKDREKEVAVGSKAKYEGENLKLSLQLERIENLDEKPNSTDFILGYDYRWNREKISSNSIHISDSSRKISLLAKNSYGVRVSKDLSLAIKNRYFIEDTRKNNLRDRLLLGVAYRDILDIYNALYKYEMVYDDKLESKDYTYLSHILSTIHNYQVGKNIFSFGLGGRYRDEYLSILGDMRWHYYLGGNFDFGINMAVLLDDRKRKFYGLGVEGGYRINDNLWLGVGYNFKGFRDRDFYEDDRYRKGVYLNFRLLLDESILDRFD